MEAPKHVAPKMDLESFISNYSGRVRLDRLICIAQSSTHLALDALRLAVIEAKNSLIPEEYVRLVKELELLAPNEPLSNLDSEWVSVTTRRVHTETARLEAELKQYKNNLIKESIRMGNEDLGNHYLAIGDYVNAHKSYSKMRENCTTTKHIIEMHLKQLYLAVLQQNWSLASTYPLKFSAVTIRGEERSSKVDPVINTAAALAMMNQTQYRDAAETFLAVNPTYMTLPPQAGVSFASEMLSPNDLAIYGGLCALATMDSPELRAKVLDNQPFRKFLELESHLRRAISMFCASKFTQCLAILESYASDYSLDLYLRKHFITLYQMIRTKSLVKWLSTFKVVTLEEIENTFPLHQHLFLDKQNGEHKLVDELVKLIQNGTLNARIDLIDQLLISPTSNQRLVSIQKTLDMAKFQERALKLRLLRINMLNAGLEVSAPKLLHSAFGESLGTDSSRSSRKKGNQGSGQGFMV